MRQAFRSIVVLLVAMVGVVGLAIGSAFTAAFAFGAVGLFVPGTGTPDANGVADYLSNARDRYTQNTPCNSEANCPTILENSQDPALLGIDYPASFFPLVIFPGWCRSGPDGCDKWNESVGKGTDALDAQLAPYLSESSQEQVTIFGYSQGGAVVSNELQRIAALKAAGKIDQSVLDRLHVVTIGGIENPDGGLWQRLGFLPTIPFFDISFGPAMKTDNGFDTTAIGFEYDPVTYAPKYFGNPLALLNAVAALETVHGYYLSPNGNGPTDTLPYGYTPGADGTLAKQLDCTANPSNCRYGSSKETTYIMIPATSLPMYDLVYGYVPAPLKPVVKPLVDLLTPATKLLVDLGYDWSGDPDVPTPLSILPFNPLTFNPVDFSAKFVAAIGQGIQDAINGGPTTLTPATTTTPVSTMAMRSIASPTVVQDVPQSTDGQAGLAPSFKKSAPVVVEKTVVENKDPVTPPPVVTTPATSQDVTGTVPVKTSGPDPSLVEAKKDDVKKVDPTTDDVKKVDPTTENVKKIDPAKDDLKKVDSTKDEPKKDAGDNGSNDAGKTNAAA